MHWIRSKGSAFPKDVLNAIKPIYRDLSKSATLKQNNNESSKQLIWKMSAKHFTGTSGIIKIATHVAVCLFNEGSLLY